MKIFTKFLLALVLGFSLFTTSCKKEDTLYVRLGGQAAIVAVVDQFLANVVGDAVINARFTATIADPVRLAALRTNLINQICSATGGSCIYTGLTMLQAHTGMNVTVTEFNALVGDLGAAMTTLGVSAEMQAEVVAILAPLQSDIVGH